MRQLAPKSLIAMIALLPLPGAPRYDGDDQRIIDQALSDLKEYQSVGVDSVLLENDHDVPYIKPPLPDEAIELVKVIAKEIRQRFQQPIGIQMLEAANETSLEIAAHADLDYVRVEGYVFAHVGSGGIVEACAGKLLRLRKELQCEHIKVFGDVKKKHCAHTLTADLDITDEVMQAEMYLIDGIVVTGKFTSIKPDTQDLARVKEVTSLPVLIGSGMTKDNIQEYLPLADGFIVGSTFRKDGRFLGGLEPSRLREFVTAFKGLREHYL